MINITEKQIDKGFKEYQYLLVGRTGNFTTCLFEAIALADKVNLVKLAHAFPEYVYAYLDYVGGLYKVDFNVIKEE